MRNKSSKNLIRLIAMAILSVISLSCLILAPVFAFFKVELIGMTGYTGMSIQDLFGKLNVATDTRIVYDYDGYVQSVTAGTLDDSTYALFDSQAKWGSRQNPFIINDYKYIKNLSVLQNLGYFDKAMENENGDIEQPHFLVCSDVGEPITIDCKSKKIAPIGTHKNPFSGFISGTYVNADLDGAIVADSSSNTFTTTKVVDKTSNTSIIYNVVVEASINDPYIGLFGKVDYYGDFYSNRTDNGDGTFTYDQADKIDISTIESGTASAFLDGYMGSVRNLVLSDVQITSKVKVGDAIADWWAKFTGANQNVEETHHVGICIGNAEYAVSRNISIYNTGTVPTFALASGADGGNVNYYSSTGIVGYLNSINPVFNADGSIVIGSGTSESNVGHNSSGGGGNASGVLSGYLIANAIYKVAQVEKSAEYEQAQGDGSKTTPYIITQKTNSEGFTYVDGGTYFDISSLFTAKDANTFTVFIPDGYSLSAANANKYTSVRDDDAYNGRITYYSDEVEGRRQILAPQSFEDIGVDLYVKIKGQYYAVWSNGAIVSSVTTTAGENIDLTPYFTYEIVQTGLFQNTPVYYPANTVTYYTDNSGATLSAKRALGVAEAYVYTELSIAGGELEDERKQYSIHIQDNSHNDLVLLVTKDREDAAALTLDFNGLQAYGFYDLSICNSVTVGEGSKTNIEIFGADLGWTDSKTYYYFADSVFTLALSSTPERDKVTQIWQDQNQSFIITHDQNDTVTGDAENYWTLKSSVDSNYIFALEQVGRESWNSDTNTLKSGEYIITYKSSDKYYLLNLNDTSAKGVPVGNPEASEVIEYQDMFIDLSGIKAGVYRLYVPNGVTATYYANSYTSGTEIETYTFTIGEGDTLKSLVLSAADKDEKEWDVTLSFIEPEENDGLTSSTAYDILYEGASSKETKLASQTLTLKAEYFAPTSGTLNYYLKSSDDVTVTLNGVKLDRTTEGFYIIKFSANEGDKTLVMTAPEEFQSPIINFTFTQENTAFVPNEWYTNKYEYVDMFVNIDLVGSYNISLPINTVPTFNNFTSYEQKIDENGNFYYAVTIAANANAQIVLACFNADRSDFHAINISAIDSTLSTSTQGTVESPHVLSKMGTFEKLQREVKIQPIYSATGVTYFEDNKDLSTYLVKAEIVNSQNTFSNSTAYLTHGEDSLTVGANNTEFGNWNVKYDSETEGFSFYWTTTKYIDILGIFQIPTGTTNHYLTYQDPSFTRVNDAADNNFVVFRIVSEEREYTVPDVGEYDAYRFFTVNASTNVATFENVMDLDLSQLQANLDTVYTLTVPNTVTAELAVDSDISIEPLPNVLNNYNKQYKIIIESSDKKPIIKLKGPENDNKTEYWHLGIDLISIGYDQNTPVEVTPVSNDGNKDEYTITTHYDIGGTSYFSSDVHDYQLANNITTYSMKINSQNLSENVVHTVNRDKIVTDDNYNNDRDSTVYGNTYIDVSQLSAGLYNLGSLPEGVYAYYYNGISQTLLDRIDGNITFNKRADDITGIIGLSTFMPVTNVNDYIHGQTYYISGTYYLIEFGDNEVDSWTGSTIANGQIFDPLGYYYTRTPNNYEYILNDTTYTYTYYTYGSPVSYPNTSIDKDNYNGTNQRNVEYYIGFDIGYTQLTTFPADVAADVFEACLNSYGTLYYTSSAVNNSPSWSFTISAYGTPTGTADSEYTLTGAVEYSFNCAVVNGTQEMHLNAANLALKGENASIRYYVQSTDISSATYNGTTLTATEGKYYFDVSSNTNTKKLILYGDGNTVEEWNFTIGIADNQEKELAYLRALYFEAQLVMVPVESKEITTFAKNQYVMQYNKDEQLYDIVKISDLQINDGTSNYLQEVNEALILSSGVSVASTSQTGISGFLDIQENSGGIVQAPIGTTGLTFNIPTGLIAFHVNNFVESVAKVKVIFVVQGVDSYEDIVEYNVGIWKMAPIESDNILSETSWDFDINNPDMYSPIPVSTKNANTDCYEYVYKVKFGDGAYGYTSLNGESALFYCEFEISETEGEGVYFLGATNEMPLAVAYFSVSGIASAGNDGTAGTATESLDFVYDNDNIIVTTTIDPPSEWTISQEDYSVYYPSSVLPFIEKGGVYVDGQLKSIQDEGLYLWRTANENGRIFHAKIGTEFEGRMVYSDGGSSLFLYSYRYGDSLQLLGGDNTVGESGNPYYLIASKGKFELTVGDGQTSIYVDLTKLMPSENKAFYTIKVTGGEVTYSNANGVTMTKSSANIYVFTFDASVFDSGQILLQITPSQSNVLLDISN